MPSLVFWTDMALTFGSATVALGLLFLVVSGGLRSWNPRRPAGKMRYSFSVFLASVAVGALAALIGDIGLLVNRGEPLLWARLAVTARYFAGPGLLAFAAALIRPASERTTSTTNAPKPKGRNGFRLGALGVPGHSLHVKRMPFVSSWWLSMALAIAGILFGLSLIPLFNRSPVLGHAYLDSPGLGRWEATGLGNTAIILTLLFYAWALALFWQRRQAGYRGLALGTAFLATAGLLDLFAHGAFLPYKPAYPVGDSLALFAGLLVIGQAVMTRHLFNPLTPVKADLQDQVAQRAQELHHATETLRVFKEHHQRISKMTDVLQRIEDENQIMERLVELVHNRLGFHHVYAYRPDEEGRNLVIWAAAGTTARTTLTNQHTVAIGGHSLLAEVAAGHRPRIAEARDDDGTYLGDTALPGARSEMVVPLLADDKLLGVLDLQSIHYQSFNDQDLSVMACLADRVALILDHTRSLHAARAAVTELYDARSKYMWNPTRETKQQAWSLGSGQQTTGLAYVYTAGSGFHASNMQPAWSEDVSRAVSQAQVCVSASGDADANGQPMEPHYGDLVPRPSGSTQVKGAGQLVGRDVLALPLRVRGQVIGALRLRHQQGHTWQTDEIDMVSEFAERMGLALEAARLSEENERRAARERLVSEITTRVRETLDIDSMLETAGREIRQALGLPHVAIRLGDSEWDPSRPGAMGHLLTVPVEVRGHTIGVLETCKPQPGEVPAARQECASLPAVRPDEPWTPDEIALIEQLVQQLGLALEDARLYQDAQHRAVRERLISEITARMRATFDTESVLRTAADEIYRALQLQQIDIYLARHARDDEKQEMGPVLCIEVQEEEDSWRILSDAGLRRDHTGIVPLKPPGLGTAAGQSAALSLHPAANERNSSRPLGPGQAGQVTLPIRVRQEIIGAIVAHKPECASLPAARQDGGGGWTPGQMELLKTLADQLGVAIEDARLYEEVQRRARQQQLLASISDRIRTAPDLDSVLRTTVQEIRRALGVSHGAIRLGTETHLQPPKQAGVQAEEK